MTFALEPSAGAPVDFPFDAKRVRQALGLNKEEERTLRKKNLGPEDWVVHKKRVCLSAAGAEKLLSAARVIGPQKIAPPSPGSNGAQPDPVKGPIESTPTVAAVVTLRVVRTDLANPHLLLACPLSDDPNRPAHLVRVRVRSTAHFALAMEIPAHLVPGYSDLYDLARALPRQKGKW